MNNLQVLEKSVVGFSQTTELVNNFGFPERRQQVHPKINSLAQEQMEVNVRAQKMGFKPLAVVPVKLLHAAFKKFGLYWFEEIDKQGRVRANIQFLKDRINHLGDKIISAKIFKPLVGLILGLSLFFLSYGAIFIRHFFSLNLMLVWVAINIAVFLVSYGFLYFFDEREEAELKILIALIYFLPRKYLIKLFFQQNDDYHKVTLHFNTPLNIFAQPLNLMRQHNLQPCVAAVPEAITVNRKELRQAIKNERQRVEREERFRRALEKDPILYYIDGNYAVIVGQYGDFASEKKLVKWVKKEALNLLLN